MFDITSSKNPNVTKGKFKRLIVESGNADIVYDEGYLDTVGNFVSLGVNTLHVEDKPETTVTDDDGNVISVTPPVTDYSDLIKAILSATEADQVKAIETFIVRKLG